MSLRRLLYGTLLCSSLALGASCKKEPMPSAPGATSNATPNPANATKGGTPGAPGAVTPPAVDAIPAPPDVAAPPADATKTATGLASKVLTPGTGTEHPEVEDRVTVHYTGWTTDGKMFDSSVKRNRPATFPLKRVIPGWTEGVQLMVQGEKRRFWIPEELAYKGQPGKPQGMLVFDVELIGIQKAPKPIPPPADVAAAPKDAHTEKSGLASKVITKGKEKVHPKATDTVEVDYTGWTTDGKMFDSSVQRGQHTSFPLNRVIPGWTEGVQLMVVGETRRFWIPEKLAYEGKPGTPQGMLVFDVTLYSITPGAGAAPGTPVQTKPVDGKPDTKPGDTKPAPGGKGATTPPAPPKSAPKKPANKADGIEGE